ncbi:hypothetical protein Acsp03_02510 [Actinomadura sp. NBRC 104412]|uniref:tetratricopeptide repeat protein n=1 Tax=Actinomadura sp. NBRC 104412 TaxID=3032203 RepID=UPI0024A20970|nr:tetratricopeptide repeat protein [Actinomadura sp. NBRC 104412]GLZ02784.1 hypothetical protein Acsp03_02510 [Actinomadura sp. NBRC 104412]
MEITEGGAVPAEAQRLHQQARMAGQEGDYDGALRLLERAHAQAPDWPYPPYDAAFTYVLMGDIVQAERAYAQVDQMAPRGFFTCKTSLHILRRELAGELHEGFARAFLMLEFLDDPGRKRAILEGIVAQFPDFAPAWKELAGLLTDDPDARLRAIESGLAATPDAETKGQLLLNKALIVNQRGDRDEAVRMLRDLVADPESTLSTVSLAKMTLEQLG